MKENVEGEGWVCILDCTDRYADGALDYGGLFIPKRRETTPVAAGPLANCREVEARAEARFTEKAK